MAVRCSVLQSIAVRCSALQCVALRCSVFHLRRKENSEKHNPLLNGFCQYVAVFLKCIAVCCSELQCVAVCSICEEEKISEIKIHD